jgi:hypothetical protein
MEQHSLSAIRLAVKDHVPALRLARAHHAALEERLDRLRQGQGAQSLCNRSVDEHVAFLRASSLRHMSSIYLSTALTNLAHSPEAFALIAGELDPALVEVAHDSVADELAYAPDQGVTAEAAAIASLLAIKDDLKLTNDHIELANSYLAKVSLV